MGSAKKLANIASGIEEEWDHPADLDYIRARDKDSWCEPSNPNQPADPSAEALIDAILDWHLHHRGDLREIVHAHFHADPSAEDDAVEDAIIAWSVCASLHREYCRKTDPMFTTRQADFVKHEANARDRLSRPPDPSSEELLAAQRIKLNVDYAVLRKYGSTHVLLNDRVWKDAIYDAFAAAHENITSMSFVSHD